MLPNYQCTEHDCESDLCGTSLVTCFDCYDVVWVILTWNVLPPKRPLSKVQGSFIIILIVLYFVYLLICVYLYPNKPFDAFK